MIPTELPFCLIPASNIPTCFTFTAYRMIPNWGQKEIVYGQVVAVALDSKGDVLVFHRGERRWDGSTFIQDTLRDQEHPITQPALLHLHKENGQIIDKWGENL